MSDSVCRPPKRIEVAMGRDGDYPVIIGVRLLADDEEPMKMSDGVRELSTGWSQRMSKRCGGPQVDRPGRGPWYLRPLFMLREQMEKANG